MFYLCPIPKQFVDHSGLPYAHGSVFVYPTGDSHLAEIYADAEGESVMENPVELDANGCWQCFVPPDVALDYIVKDVGGNVINKYVQVVPGSGEGSGQGVTRVYVDRQDGSLRSSINSVSTLLQIESERAIQAEIQARSTVSAGSGVQVKAIIKQDGHADFEVSAEDGVHGIRYVVPDSDNVHVVTSQDGETAYIGVDKAIAFITTQTTLAQARSILDKGELPVLRYEFAEDDVWFLALREDDRDGNYMIFSGPTSTSGVFAYAQLYSSGWTMPRTYGLATQESLQSERQTRAAADADLQEQIDNVQIDVDDSLSTDSTNPVENRVVTGAVNSKQDQIPQEQLDEMTDQEIDDLMASLN